MGDRMQRIFNLYQKISDKSYSTLAGSIAFFLIINGGSVLCLVLNICNNMGYNIFDYFNTDYLPDQISTIITAMYIDSLRNNYSIFFTITSIISGSTLFYHLIKTTEIIYDTKMVKQNFFNRILSIIIVIIFLLLVITMFIFFLISNYFTKGTFFNVLVKYLTMIIAPFIITLFISKTVTPKNNKVKEVYLGVIFSTIFWFVATILFSIYLDIFLNYKMTFGSLSFFIVFMIWIYLLSQGLIIGFIINYNNSLKKDIIHKI